MLIHVLWILVSVPMLYFGAEVLVSGSSALAKELRIRATVIGLTVVAFATSGPEFVVGIVATLRGVQDVTVGDVIGANVANVGLIIGVSALLCPLIISRITAHREIPLTIGVQIVLFFLVLNGTIGRHEGAILILLLIAFIVYMIRTAKDTEAAAPAPGTERNVGRTFWLIAKVTLGIGLLVTGGYFLVESATYIAERAGITNLTIGATMVAFLTTVPELATSAIAARRGEGEIAVGNAVGSILFNSACVLGTAALINPINVEPATAHIKIPIMLSLLILLAILILHRRRLSRVQGAFLLACYIGFVIYSIFTGGAAK